MSRFNRFGGNRRNYRRQTVSKPQREDVRIEFPSRGATYCKDKYGVYKYDVYPSSSVLAGQQRRTFLDQFDTLEEAQQKYPNATYHGDGASGYQAPDLSHLPEEGDPENY